MAETILAVAYFRDSDDKQDSIPEQRAWARSAAKRHDVVIVREFEDHGVPGALVEHRPDLMAMLLFCEQQAAAGRPIRAVVCWDADRFSRADSIDTAACISRLRHAGTTRMLTAEGWTDWEDDTDRMLYHLKQDLARSSFSRTMSRAVARSMLERAKQGLHVGGQIPYGYILGPDGKLALGDPREVEVVRWLFQQASSRVVSLGTLARELNDRGVPPPSRRTKRRPRRVMIWVRQDVPRILDNRKYCGDFVWNLDSVARYHKIEGDQVVKAPRHQSNGKKVRLQHNPPEDAIIVPDAHPAIIDRETFEEVRRRLTENRAKLSTPAPRGGHFILTGLLFCGKCGGSMCGDTSRTTASRGKVYEYRRYVCSTSKHCGAAACDISHISQEEVLDAAVGLIEQEFTSPEALDHIEAQLKALVSESEQDHRSRLASLEARLARLDADITQGVRNLTVLPEDMVAAVAEEVRKLRKQREEVVTQLARSDVTTSEDGADVAARVEDALARLRSLAKVVKDAPPAEARDALHGLVKKIVLHFAPAPPRSRYGRKTVLAELEVHIVPEVTAILATAEKLTRKVARRACRSLHLGSLILRARVTPQA